MRSRSTTTTGAFRKAVVGVAAFSLLAAACGGDDDDSSSAEPSAEESTADAEAAEPSEEASAEPSEEMSEEASEEMSEEMSDDASAEESSSAGPDTTVSGEMIIQPGECGLNNGEEATGDPIKLGAGATNVPGVDFTWGPKMSQIYFDCVNANGGIYGHPIEFQYEDGVPDPAAWQALATKLVEEEQVHAVVGTFSLVECDVNTDYYRDNGYSPIIAGVAPTCFLDDTWSAVNMGPYYSNLGAAQAVVRAGAQGKLVAASPDQPGMDFNNTSVEDFALTQGMEFEGFLEPVPIADPAAFAQQLVSAAGEGGGVVLNYTGPTVVPLLEAIADQGLVDTVIWGSSTPPNDPTVAQALQDCCGTDWNGKFLINAEFDLLDSGKPDAALHVDLHGGTDDFPLSAFSQMGFLIAKSATEALLRMGPDAEYTIESVNAAIRGLDNMESDMWCKPWYFSNDLGTGNVSNNTDRTVVPEDGNMVLLEDCFDIAAIDAGEAGANGNPLNAIRDAEAAAAG